MSDAPNPPLTAPPPPPTSSAPAPSSALTDLNSLLTQLKGAVDSGLKTKDNASSLIDDVEKLIGVQPAAPAAPASDNGSSILTILAVGALLLVGAVLVYKVVKSRGAA